MKLSIFAKQAKKLVANNAPAILTSVGVAGALTTAYLVGKASFKVSAELVEIQNGRNEANARGELDIDEIDLTFRTKFDLVWKEFVPAAAVAALTVAAIIGANHISTRRAAAMASALTVSDRIFTEYKAKVVEKMGEKKEQAVHDEVVADRVSNLPKKDTEIVVLSGDVLCLDVRSDRTFTGNMEDIRRAVNDINEELHNESYVALSRFYELVGLRDTAEATEVGWRAGEGLLKPRFTSALTSEGRPCLAVDFDVKPHYRYDRSY